MEAYSYHGRSRPALTPAGAGVYSANDIQDLFGWRPLPPRDDRPRLLASELRGRAPGAEPLVVVYDTDGAVFGTAPAGGQLYNFSVPTTRPLTRALGSPAGQWEFQAALFTLAARLAAVTSEAGVRDALAQFRRQVHPNDVGGGDPEATIAVAPLPPGPDEEAGGEGLNETSVIGRLLATYKDRSCPHIQAPGRHRPPQPGEVRRVVDGLLPLLFPGYRGPLPSSPGFESFVCRRASSLQHRLTRLVRRALTFRRSLEAPVPALRAAAGRAQAEGVVVSFFKHLPGIRRTLEADVRAAKEKDPALPEVGPGTVDHHEVPLAYPGLWATAVYRLAHRLHALGVPYVPRMMTELAHERTGIDIHPGATVGPGFFIDHGTGVVIGQTSVIGAEVTLYQGVTLGALNFPVTDDGEYDREAKRHPTIQRGSTVFANAAVLGDITVGSDSTVGANVSLRQEVPPQSVVRVPHTLRELSISGQGPDEVAGSPVGKDPQPFLPTELRRSLDDN